MLTHLTIKTRLLANSGLLLALFVLALAIHQFALFQVSAAVSQADDDRRHYNDKAWSIKVKLQEARQAVTEFALHSELLQADQVEQNLAEIERLTLDIRYYAEAQHDTSLAAQARAIAAAATTYKGLFKQIMDARVQRGLAHDLGLVGHLREVAHQIFQEQTSEHAVGAVLNELVQAQAILTADDIMEKGRRDALDLAVSSFVHMFNAQVPNTSQYAELYRWFDSYQLAIHYFLVAAANPDATTRPLAETKAVERAATPLRDGLLKTYVPNVASLILEIRRYEKDYLLRHDQASIDNLHRALEAIRQAFINSRVAQSHIDDVNRTLNNYLETFNALLAIDRQLDDLSDRLQAESRQVENLVAEMMATSDTNNQQSEAKARHMARLASLVSIGICLAALAIGLWLTLIINRSINRPLQKVLEALQLISQGDYSARLSLPARDEIGRLSTMFNHMAENIKGSQWLNSGRSLLAEELREDKTEEHLARDIISFLAQYLNVQAGAFHVAQADRSLHLTASFAGTPGDDFPMVVQPGEGLIGEAARSQRLLVIDQLPADYLRLESGLGSAVPVNLLLLPVLWRHEVRGVIELATGQPFTEAQLNFLKEVADGIAIALYSCRQRQETLALLDETQAQAARLQTQQEELRAANEELEEQTQTLRLNEEELKAQQEELQAANEELEEKSEYLLHQKNDLTVKNRELEEAWVDIDAQARELVAANRYKSEFLANMSHELRTPLNSLLLLARNLSQNKGGNLEPSQVESALVIYHSGQDLLRLINDILDLSKIEAGRMDINHESIGLRGLGDWLRTDFAPLLADKGLTLTVELDQKLPTTIESDRLRIEQILRNLVGNAIKFTKHGGVTVRFMEPPPDTKLTASGLDPSQTIAIAVEDTGIGITPEQQKIIFNAFQQAEGGTARRYGGTGLGLSISKKLAGLLGGEIKLESQPGQGATFTLFLPLQRPAPVVVCGPPAPLPLPLPHPALEAAAPAAPAIPDDREHLGAEQKRLLIIEDDLIFANIVQAQGHKQGFQCLVAASGLDGLRLAKTYTPGAIILDIRLPDIDGWQVLATLKNDPGLRHIPVHMMSGQEKTMEALRKGAIGFLSKPVTEEEMLSAFARLEDASSKRMRNLLVVEDDKIIGQGITELIGNGDVIVTSVVSGELALAALRTTKYDCMILDIGLPDMSGFELLDRLSGDETSEIPPVIIYTGRELTREEGMTLAKYTDTVIIKGVKSEERLLDETALFLHRVVSKLPVEKRKMIASLYDQDTMFRDKRIMVVDDDLRNSFALSRILEERGMKIILANDGRHALELLDKDPGVDLILMDIMMPVLDGYQTTKLIRAQERFWDLPIIALTAKALPEDKEKCMASGASDYLTKPVNEDRLLAMMRVWLYR